MAVRTRHVALTALIATTVFALAVPASATAVDSPTAVTQPLLSGTTATTGTATAPGMPAVSAQWVRSTEATFSWNAANGGSPITGYKLRLVAGDAVVDERNWDTRTSIWISDLRPAMSYELRVAAVNTIGTGSYAAYRFTTPRTSVERLYGATRFDTAVRVSERAFPDSGVPAGFVANGLNFPDALAAAAAAGALGGPVLLTNPSTVPAPVVTELGSLAPDYVFVAGGAASVTDAVAKKTSQAATSNAFRLSGQNRFGTAADVATLWDTADVVYLANGMDFPDALAGAAAAGAMGAPVLLAEKTRLPAETRSALARLRPAKIVVLGGTGVISSAVASAAVASTGVTTSTQRLAGADRFSTAVEISKATFKISGVPVVYVASGASFADALAGAAAAGYRGGPVLLTDSRTVPASVLAEVKRLRPHWIVVLGGPTVVSDAVRDRLHAAATS